MIIKGKFTNKINSRGDEMTQKSFIIFKVLFIMVAITIFHPQVSAKIVVNYTETAYESSVTEPMNSLIVNGAGSYLKSQANYFQFLNRIEMEEVEGLDYSELHQLLLSALTNIENTRVSYEGLTQLADVSDYNSDIIATLKDFDYASFKQNGSLSNDSFNEVEGYLKSGDIRNLYHRMLSDVTEISEKLETIKIDVEAGKTPVLTQLWRLNQLYFQTQMRGQYAAEIFSQITGK